jgi:hypothetical protein
MIINVFKAPLSWAAGPHSIHCYNCRTHGQYRLRNNYADTNTTGLLQINHFQVLEFLAKKKKKKKKIRNHPHQNFSMK